MRAQEALRFIVNRLGVPSYKVFLIKPEDFNKVSDQYKSLGGEVTKAVSDFEKDFTATASTKIGLSKSVEEAGKISEEAPVTKMLGVILRYAVEGKASDVHVEPTQDKVKIRFRVDGVLYTGLFLPKGTHSALITKIKVMTNMKIDESRIPQDGRFHARVLDKEIDFRVSTFPTTFGEKIAIRILDPGSGAKSLEDLGIEGRNKEMLLAGIKRSFGLVLITGPTGSGKSTTLYTLLKEIDRESLNVVTLEDPVEYFMPGINQSQVRPEINYDFASGLRSISDVIMVGEIRDKETAQLAVHSALTGHLVLSTLHTNNSIGVIPRLIDMGVDPFLLPSTLAIAVGQRLARRLCPESRKTVPIEGRVKEIVDEELATMPSVYQEEVKALNTGSVYEGEASSACPKGTRGRIGVYEVLAMTPALEKIILEGPSEAKILAEARRQNMLTMRQDGVLKALRGIIGLNDLLEVI
ncbi:MAG: type II/IV secretion system protein [Candidatus Sungbacteria bacterium]|nr:type II/IV secretion system protein [Candidatus Sungbacteria bacterium]